MTEKEKSMLRRLNKNKLLVNIYRLNEEDRRTLQDLIRQQHVTFILDDDRETQLYLSSDEAQSVLYEADKEVNSHADEPLYTRSLRFISSRILLKRFLPHALVFSFGFFLGFLLKGILMLQ